MNLKDIKDINEARPLLILGDMITTDHISPAGINSKRKSYWRIFYETSNINKRL